MAGGSKRCGDGPRCGACGAAADNGAAPRRRPARVLPTPVRAAVAGRVASNWAAARRIAADGIGVEGKDKVATAQTGLAQGAITADRRPQTAVKPGCSPWRDYAVGLRAERGTSPSVRSQGCSESHQKLAVGSSHEVSSSVPALSQSLVGVRSGSLNMGEPQLAQKRRIIAKPLAPVSR